MLYDPRVAASSPLASDTLQQRVPHCCGCAACANVCPSHAISMVVSHEGFYRPSINEQTCIGCHRCLHTCPLLEEEARRRAQAPHKQHLFRYGWITDPELRRESSGGGLFSALALAVLAKGGCVFGVVMGDDLRPYHTKAETAAELQAMRGSKYLPSRVGDIYRELRRELRSGRQVLFSGVPCQIGGLLAYLGYKRPPNLLLVDLVCHGVPSLHLWDCYLHEEQQKRHATGAPRSVSFRDKSSGWNHYGYSIRKDWGAGDVQYTPQRQDTFARAFLSNLFLSEACYNCRYQDLAGRLSDITLGDAWGIWEELPEEQCAPGVSLAVIHTEAGEALCRELSGTVLEPRSPEQSLRHNPALARAAARPAAASAMRRKLFSAKPCRLSLEKLLRRITPGRLRTRLRNLLRRWLNTCRQGSAGLS